MDAQRASLLITVEAASYAALFLTDRDRSLFAIRSTLVGALVTAQYWSGRQPRTARRHSGAYSEK